LQIADVLSRHNTICIGFSGTDPNFRFLTRLIMKNKLFDKINRKREVWLTYKYFDTFLDESKKGDINAFACFEALIGRAESYFYKQFGIKLLWAEDYYDMAEKIKSLAERLANDI
jgi:hypothetical protein